MTPQQYAQIVKSVQIVKAAVNDWTRNDRIWDVSPAEVEASLAYLATLAEQVEAAERQTYEALANASVYERRAVDAEARVKDVTVQWEAWRDSCKEAEAQAEEYKDESEARHDTMIAAIDRCMAAEAQAERLRDALHWYYVCAGFPEWFGDDQRARLITALNLAAVPPPERQEP